MYQINKVNGLTAIVSSFKGVETASLGFFLDVGSRFETKESKGIAHFLEHLLFKGSSKYSYKKIKQEIEGRGGALNAFTSHEITAYYAYFLKKNFDKTFDILFDMVCNPLLRDSDIEKERTVILEEIKMYNDLPSSRVQSLLESLIWPKHPLGEEVLGSPKTVASISRTDLKKFKEKYYSPENIVFSFCGDIERDDLLKRITASMESMPSSSATKKSLSPQNLQGLNITVESKKLEQAYLCLGFRSLSYQSKFLLCGELVNVLLGANMSSRLFEEVREKRGLCYDISTDVRKYKDSGAFVVSLGLDKAKVLVALKAILEQLNKIKTIPVSKSELSRAKDFFLGQLAMLLERPQGRMFYLAENYLAQKKVQQYRQIQEEIDKITPEDIQKIASLIIDQKNMALACIGDFDLNFKDKIYKTVVG